MAGNYFSSWWKTYVSRKDHRKRWCVQPVHKEGSWDIYAHQPWDWSYKKDWEVTSTDLCSLTLTTSWPLWKKLYIFALTTQYHKCQMEQGTDATHRNQQPHSEVNIFKHCKAGSFLSTQLRSSEEWVLSTFLPKWGTKRDDGFRNLLFPLRKYWNAQTLSLLHSVIFWCR